MNKDFKSGFVAIIGRPNVDNPTNENTIASRNTNGNAAPSPSDK